MKNAFKLSIAPLFFAVVLISCCKEESRTCTCKDSTGNIQSEEVLRSHDMREIEKFEENCGQPEKPKCGKHENKATGSTSSSNSGSEADRIKPTTTSVEVTCEVH